MSAQSERFLTKKQAALMLGISWHTLDRWAKKPDFPKPVNLGARIRYLESEISGWIQKTVEASRNKRRV